MARLTLAFLVLTVVVGSSLGRKFSNSCELARELRRHGFNERDLPHWVCLIFAESSGDTSALGTGNSDGSKDYGLFQINSRYWCGIKQPGGGCKVKCNALLDNDISNDSKCAKHIKSKQGFSAWVGWKRDCKGKELEDLSNC